MKTKITPIYLSILTIFILATTGFGSAGDVKIKIREKKEIGNIYVLSVGIDEYSDTSLGSLSGAKNDALGVSEVLRTKTKTVLLDQNATKERILQELDRLSREIGSDDIFVFTYSGQGNNFSENNIFNLLAADSRRNDPVKTGVSNTILREYFRRIRAKNKIILLDACRSADGFDIATEVFLESDSDLKNLQEENILFIGTDNTTYEKYFRDEENNKEVSYGVISKVVIDGLQGKADINNDRLINSRELEAYIYKGLYDPKYEISKGLYYFPRIISRGNAFEIVYYNEKSKDPPKDKVTSEKNEIISEIVKTAQVDKKPVQDTQPEDGDETRTTGRKKSEEEKNRGKWQGESYALLFANDEYDNPKWKKLKNPQNDVNDVTKELKDRYGFKEVIIKENLRTKEIINEINSYKTKEFKNNKEDQLFIFFAGHGVANEDGVGGFYVGRDSPHPFTYEENGRFVSLNGILTAIDKIPVNHIMVVFDACYAGEIWKPAIILNKNVGSSVQKYNDDLAMEDSSFIGRNVGAGGRLSDFAKNDPDIVETQQIPKLEYARRKMKEKSRVILTSGDEPVYDSWIKANGERSDNSPFADGFLRALQTNGGSNEVLTTDEIKPFIDGLPIEPQVGNLSNTDGDFVFVKRDG